MPFAFPPESVFAFGGIRKIEYAVCEEKIREAIAAARAMEAYVQHLVARLEQSDRFDELYSQLDLETEQR